MRRKNNPGDDEVVHYLVLWGPQQTIPVITLIRRARISGHYVADLKYARSGRGVLLSSQRNEEDELEEGILAFDVRRRHPKTGHVVPAAEAPWRPLSRVRLPPDARLENCTALDYDDAEGRVVVANQSGIISIFDLV